MSPLPALKRQRHGAEAPPPPPPFPAMDGEDDLPPLDGGEEGDEAAVELDAVAEARAYARKVLRHPTWVQWAEDTLHWCEEHHLREVEGLFAAAGDYVTPETYRYLRLFHLHPGATFASALLQANADEPLDLAQVAHLVLIWRANVPHLLLAYAMHMPMQPGHVHFRAQEDQAYARHMPFLAYFFSICICLAYACRCGGPNFSPARLAFPPPLGLQAYARHMPTHCRGWHMAGICQEGVSLGGEVLFGGSTAWHMPCICHHTAMVGICMAYASSGFHGKVRFGGPIAWHMPGICHVTHVTGTCFSQPPHWPRGPPQVDMHCMSPKFQVPLAKQWQTLPIGKQGGNEEYSVELLPLPLAIAALLFHPKNWDGMWQKAEKKEPDGVREYSHPFTCDEALRCQAEVDAKPKVDGVTNLLVGLNLGDDKTEVERMRSAHAVHLKLLNTGKLQWFMRHSKILLALLPMFAKDEDAQQLDNTRAGQQLYQRALALLLVLMEVCARLGILMTSRYKGDGDLLLAYARHMLLA